MNNRDYKKFRSSRKEDRQVVRTFAITICTSFFYMFSVFNNELLPNYAEESLIKIVFFYIVFCFLCGVVKGAITLAAFDLIDYRYNRKYKWSNGYQSNYDTKVADKKSRSINDKSTKSNND